VAENLVGVDMTVPGGQQTMLVAKSVVREFESRRTRSFSSLCNVQVIEDPAQSRKSKRYFTKKLEDLPDRLLLPQKEAAIKLGVSPRTVGTLLASGLLKSTLIGGRRLVSMIDLQKFARSDHPDIGTRGPY
jgi:helix-turn-helix protein